MWGMKKKAMENFVFNGVSKTTAIWTRVRDELQIFQFLQICWVKINQFQQASTINFYSTISTIKS